MQDNLGFMQNNNENPLFNLDFRDPINQNGAASYDTVTAGASMPSIDGWTLNGGKADFDADGLLLTPYSAGGSSLFQVFEGYEEYNGREVTLAAEKGDGTLVVGTARINTASDFNVPSLPLGGAWTLRIQGRTASNAVSLAIRHSNSSAPLDPIAVKRVGFNFGKIFRGFRLRNKTLELIRARYFYRRYYRNSPFQDSENFAFRNNESNNANSANFTAVLPFPMRIPPAVTDMSGLVVRSLTSPANIADVVFSVNAGYTTRTQISITATKQGGFTPGAVYVLSMGIPTGPGKGFVLDARI
jgi:hypothetical protein